MTKMFYNWLRWQCLNRKEYYGGEILKGEIIDDDDFILQMLKLIDYKRKLTPYTLKSE